ncbi:membrane-bound alkaline phosphatase-like [Spodoptera litura]|uniref:Alkaline phosphatase n=1 Tax=Spodoptera litura TaxID=69820 RepID=A0A9J7ITQ4_SPOLT|nr:membrane-bound alkaline phosphatase-like [Spodoptera litura]
MAARAHTGAALLLLLALARPSHERDVYHKLSRSVETATSHIPEVELDQQFWYDEAQAAINARLAHKESVKKARNVVMFLGDGMSVPTLAAARTLLGQRRGHTGEEAHLAFEKFPTVGLAKTYCVDAQIADSACSATAYLGGVKANIATIGVSARVPHGACAAALDPAHHVHSIAEWALSDGRDAGVVTTTRVTHASPAGAYAHTAHRDWEADADVAASCAPPRQDDIALQLVHAYPGDHFKVILGGGRREFLPNSTVDEEGSRGKRLDGRNLIEEWQESKRAQNVSYRYVWNREQLMDAAEDLPEYLLGLFEGSHMQYHMQADPATEPTLAELTEVAIRSLSRNQNGFFLFVEGGRIDHAHHENLVQLSLDEAIELSKAVERAAQLLSEEDSLLVVTSDHAHVMTLNGYTHRGSDIIGPSDDRGDDGVPYMTLSYANGPGYRPPSAAGLREDVTQYNYHDVNFAFPASVPLDSETHGGDDVAVFARGPHHSMFTGLYEQSQLPHLMAYAACIGPGRHACQH